MLNSHVRRAILLVGCMLLTLALGTGAVLASRVALVIGNSAYRNVAALPNPANDATDLAASLQRLGFAVTQASNVKLEDMRRALIAFGRQSRSAEIALIFFAGHGMEIGGENWLIPVDAELRSDTDAENEAVSLRSVMLQVSHASRLGLVILDACRNNPFAAKMQRSTRVRAVERGLVRTEPADNVLVAYASRDGTAANDGTGRNSPFTTALLRHIETPGLEVTFLFRNVRDDVMAATRREQQPFVYGSLSREQIYLKTAPAAAGEAERAWTAAQSTTSIAVLEEFIRRFGDSFYATLARARLEELKKTSQVAVVAPPVPPGADPIATRKALMRSMGAATKTGGQMVRGDAPYDQTKAQEILATYIDAADKMPTLFPDNSKSGGETTASARIWQDPNGFKAGFAKLKTEATAANVSVKGIDSFKAWFGGLTKNCGNCHETYRLKKS
jgi:uncharacterized caspase-like protein/cytochrome c556